MRRLFAAIVTVAVTATSLSVTVAGSANADTPTQPASQLVIGGPSGTVAVINTTTPEITTRTLPGAPTAIAAADEGDLLAWVDAGSIHVQGSPDGPIATIPQPDGTQDTAPALSPDGTRLTFTRSDAGARTVQVADLTTMTVTPVPDGCTTQFAGPAWLDDTSVTFGGCDDSIRVVDLVDGTVRQLPAPHPGTMFGPAVETTSTAGILVMTLVGSQVRASLVDPTDGTVLVDASYGSWSAGDGCVIFGASSRVAGDPSSDRMALVSSAASGCDPIHSTPGVYLLDPADLTTVTRLASVPVGVDPMIHAAGWAATPTVDDTPGDDEGQEPGEPGEEPGGPGDDDSEPGSPGDPGDDDEVGAPGFGDECVPGPNGSIVVTVHNPTDATITFSWTSNPGKKSGTVTVPADASGTITVPAGPGKGASVANLTLFIGNDKVDEHHCVITPPAQVTVTLNPLAVLKAVVVAIVVVVKTVVSGVAALFGR